MHSVACIKKKKSDWNFATMSVYWWNHTADRTAAANYFQPGIYLKVASSNGWNVWIIRCPCVLIFTQGLCGLLLLAVLNSLCWQTWRMNVTVAVTFPYISIPGTWNLDSDAIYKLRTQNCDLWVLAQRMTWFIRVLLAEY